uniref:NB-ARC domain-containing protein n=2 Tax=Opuntia streptacantha TaxID=393608 RepID=A0A7C8ZDH4_OPUST
MSRELTTSLLAANSFCTFNPLNIWKSIKFAKNILKFIGEFPEWINYNNHLERKLQNLSGKMESLEGVKSDVRTQLENTEFQTGRKRKREVDHWIASVQKKAVQVRNVENHVNSISHLPRFLFRAWLGSCIEQEIRQVNELHKQGKFPEGLLLNAPENGGEPFVTTGLVGRIAGEKLDQIWAHIINPRTTRIGVQGHEGMGKSALMARLYNRLCSCCRVYYVNVPQCFSLYKLQAAIALELKVKLPLHEGSEARRASRLFRVLNSKKEFVLFLDGVSRDFCLEDVGIPWQGSGMKIVLASRSLDVCRRMSCQETVVLERLCREDSETLFMEKLASYTPVSEEIKDLVGEAVARCEGIPSRIITMAFQLRGVYEVNDWRDTLNEM